MASTFAPRLLEVTTTPRGVPVLPEVYWMRAVSSPLAGSGGGGGARVSVRGSIKGRAGSSSPESRRCAAVRRSASTAEGAASRTTLVSRFTNAAGRANPSSEGSGTGTAPSALAPRNASRKARPVGRQSSTRSPRPRPLRASAAAQVPAPRVHSAKVTGSSRNEPRDALCRRWTAMRSGSCAARARSRVAIGSDIRDQSLHQPGAEAPPQARGGEPAAVQLIGNQRAVPVQHAEGLQPIEGVAAHAALGKLELAPHRLGEERGDAGPDALEHQILHLREDLAGQGLRERLAQLLAVGEVARLVLEVDAEDGGEERLARLGQQGRDQRRRGPLEHHLADQQLHLGRGAILDRLQRRAQPPAGRIEDAGLLRQVPLQGEEVLGLLLRHHREELAVRGPLAGGEDHHLRDQVFAAPFAGEQVGEVEAGLAEDERPLVPRGHAFEGAEAAGEEALVREGAALRIDLELPGKAVERPRVLQRGIDQGGDPVHAVTACSDTATVVPRPGSLSTRTVPCCAATSSWTMERPRPVPEPGGLVVKKGSKIRERFSLEIPQPLSTTEISTRSPVRKAAIFTSPPSGATACTALWTMFRITWKRSCGFARTTSPSISCTIRTPFGVCGATIFTASGTTSASFTEAAASPLCLRPKRSSCRVTAVIRSTLSSMSASIGPAESLVPTRGRSSERFPRRKWSGLFISW